jgi:uncharacterized repeat protein (TIGR01451 family)
MRYRRNEGWTGTKAFTAGVLATASAAFLPAAAMAAGTPAGTTIQNSATATYDQADGSEASVESNVVSLLVDELVDVTVSWADPGDVATAPGVSAKALRFTLTNGGNGPEAFILSTAADGGGDDFDPVVTAVVLDTNGNDAYDPGVDTVYVAGSNDPVLAADQSVSIFVLASTPASVQDGQRGRVDLMAAAKTGTGAPGTSFAGQGQGGGNAVVGATGGDAEHTGWFKASRASLTFAKSAAVADAFGGTAQAPGSTVTYTLVAQVTGGGTLSNVRIADPIPAGTTYAPGSITLEGAPLTDAADADAGSFSGSGIAVSLGNLAAGSTRTVTFQVKID